MAKYQPPKKGYYADLQELVRNNPGANLQTLQRLAGMGEYIRQQGVSSDMYETPEQMLEDMEARKGKEAPQQPAAPTPRQAAQPASFSRPQSQQSGGSMFNPMQQMAMHRGMASDVMSEMGDELDSRVAQAREHRRLQHEKDMEAMRQEGVLKRLQMERETAERQMRMARELQDRQNGVLFSTDWGR
jgi:hypothetical protein